MEEAVGLFRMQQLRRCLHSAGRLERSCLPRQRTVCVEGICIASVWQQLPSLFGAHVCVRVCGCVRLRVWVVCVLASTT